jgi:hypothetical protein
VVPVFTILGSGMKSASVTAFFRLTRLAHVGEVVLSDGERHVSQFEHERRQRYAGKVPPTCANRGARSALHSVRS